MPKEIIFNNIYRLLIFYFAWICDIKTQKNRLLPIATGQFYSYGKSNQTIQMSCLDAIYRRPILLLHLQFGTKKRLDKWSYTQERYYMEQIIDIR